MVEKAAREVPANCQGSKDDRSLCLGAWGGGPVTRAGLSAAVVTSEARQEPQRTSLGKGAEGNSSLAVTASSSLFASPAESWASPQLDYKLTLGSSHGGAVVNESD